ncbi:MAG: FimB/Mfa2 family fimbrial subunit [Culturomica sp.]|jgi:hypothetical protein|nr:FimB/Mfa2 family fimbrial subunit [Culturomica sp.]
MSNRILLFLLAALLFMGACIREHTDPCVVSGPRLLFSYTWDGLHEDDLASRVQDMRVYVFDQSTGLLAAILPVNAADVARGYINAPLPDGVYTMVVWAGSSNNLLAGGFKDAQASGTNPDGYASPATVGVTTLTDFRMMLAYNTLSGDTISQITPQTVKFDNLFFGIARDVVISGGTGQEIRFDMTKSSSRIRFRIVGIQYLNGVNGPSSRAADSLNIFLVGRNGILTADNSVDGNAQKMRYNPYVRLLDTNTLEVDIQTLRLVIGQSMLLYIQSLYGANLIPPIDVMQTILQVKDNQGNARYKNQQEIDREEEFLIQIVIEPNLSLRVTVNGFRTEVLYPKIIVEPGQ